VALAALVVLVAAVTAQIILVLQPQALQTPEAAVVVKDI
jgi:hypothetical protein